jgi:hypothetical protein
MSKDILTFHKYIISNSSNTIHLFKNTFNSKIDSLPDKIVSSKFLIKYLQIKSQFEFQIFQNTFLDYFKYKLLSS